MDYTRYQGLGRRKSDGKTRDLTFLDSVSEWVPEILCLATDTGAHTEDKVLGGIDGVANAQAQALANRTVFLRNSVQQLSAIISTLMLNLAPQLSLSKNLVVSKAAPKDWTYKAWLNVGVESPSPSIRFVFDDRSDVINPTLRLTLDDGKIIFIRTDGQSVAPEDIGN